MYFWNITHRNIVCVNVDEKRAKLKVQDPQILMKTFKHNNNSTIFLHRETEQVKRLRLSNIFHIHICDY